MQIEEFGVETWINNYEQDCTYNLTNTCVGVLSTRELLNLTENPKLAEKNILDMELGYGRVFGSERLRADIASLYESANDENIVITHGAVGANSLLMMTLVEQGDKVVSVLPIYQQHYSIPEEFGGMVERIYLKEENGWLPDLEELRKAVTPDTKMICLNDPNNPTGAVIDDDYMAKIVDIARSVGAYILCDEVYRGLTHNGEPFGKSIFDMYEKGISTCSMSKAFSLPGLRLGWIVANKNVVEKINVQRNYHVICVGRINDYLASLAIENRDKIVARNIEICKKNLEMLDDWVQREPHITYVKPQGGTTVFLKYDIDMPSCDLCLKLQRETGVMFLPGAVMDMEGYLRMGYTGDFEKTKKALAIFSEWLSKF